MLDPPPDGVCQVAVVELVAVRTWPLEGAVAALTSTVVVADFKAFVIPDVSPVAVPVRFVAAPLEGVPRAHPFTTGDHAVPMFTARAVAIPVPSPDTHVEIGSPVRLVATQDAGVPKAGVTRVGEVANTKAPLHVSSLITHFSSSEVVEANCARVPDVRASHPPAGLDHFKPVASAESAVRTCPFVPTARREAVFAHVPTAKSPLASHIESVATDPPPDIVISPLPRSEFQFTVLMFVPETSVACLASSAVCVAVDMGSSASVVSLRLLESETSAIKIMSHVAGVTDVVSVGKRISDIVFCLRNYSCSIGSSSYWNISCSNIDDYWIP